MRAHCIPAEQAFLLGEYWSMQISVIFFFDIECESEWVLSMNLCVCKSGMQRNIFSVLILLCSECQFEFRMIALCFFSFRTFSSLNVAQRHRKCSSSIFLYSFRYRQSKLADNYWFPSLYYFSIFRRQLFVRDRGAWFCFPFFVTPIVGWLAAENRNNLPSVCFNW